MGKRTHAFFVDGMTCASCEARIERALVALPGVLGAKAEQRGGHVVFEFDECRTSPEAAKAAIEKVGYAVRDKRNAGTLIALGIGLALAASYMIASSAGLFAALPKVDASLGYGMLFVVGLMTSVHCVAMCGGISLSQSVRSAVKHPANSAPATAVGRGSLESLAPGLMYNGGRVISYSIIGGMVGALGSAFAFSPAVKGAITGAAGLFMLYLGLKMLGLVPALLKASRALPAGLGAGIGNLRRLAAGRGPFAVGLLNGLMPCGPLQTMQLYALGTGSFLAGALSMLIFSIGTVPLMLGFSLAASLLPRRILPIMVKASAVLVMFLGAVTFARAAALAGIALPSFGSSAGSGLAAQTRGSGSSLTSDSGAAAESPAVLARDSAGIVAKLEKGVQTVTTEFKNGRYVPFTVQVGVPLRWTVYVTGEELNGCDNPVTIPEYGVSKNLTVGANLIEFTPRKTGTIAYTCWMGMISSSITVVKGVSGGSISEVPPSGSNNAVAEAPGDSLALTGQASGTHGLLSGRVPTDVVGMPVIKDGVQEITITVDDRGFTPAAIVLQKGMKAVIKFRASRLNSCNEFVMFPEYNGGLDLSKGQLETPALEISRDFSFQCWMGMLHGYVKAVDDLSKVDASKVRAEVAAYRASSSSGSGGCCAR
jgi:sulfite exporter TauE/SafE/plastocyanin domain-containing protein/copper chaperone CopZ